MKKKNWLAVLALLSTTVLLAACGSTSNGSSEGESSKETAHSSSEEKKSDKEIATEDAETFLNAVLTADDQGFSRLYGEKYDQWTENQVFPDQAATVIADNELTPEADYTLKYATDFDEMTPTQVITNFLKSRRDNLKDVQTYDIKDVTVDGDKATITVHSRNINNKAAANAITNLYLILFDGDVGALAGMNQANKLDGEFKKLQTLISYFLYQSNFDNLLVGYSDVPLRLNETPLTEGTYDVVFDLEKNEDGHWVMSPEDYRNFVSDYMNDSETASQVVYPDGTTSSDSDTSESSSSDSDA